MFFTSSLPKSADKAPAIVAITQNTILVSDEMLGTTTLPQTPCSAWTDTTLRSSPLTASARTALRALPVPAAQIRAGGREGEEEFEYWRILLYLC